MILGEKIGGELARLMTATAICSATVTVAPGLGLLTVGVIGLVEALLGVAGLTHALWRRRAEGFAAVARRCTREIDDGSDAWIEDEFRGLPDAAIWRDAAIGAIARLSVVPVSDRHDTLTSKIRVWDRLGGSVACLT
jgi:hypothetical protein